MKLPLSPEQQAWMQNQNAPRKGTAMHDRGKQCLDCIHMREHPINDSVLCGQRKPNIKTKRTNTCNLFEKR